MSTAAPPVEERRISTRLRPAAGTVCRIDPIDDSAKPAVGLVWNISLSGVSMLLGTLPKLGEILTGELALESGEAKLQVIFRAIRVGPVPTGDYMLGAQFLRELTDEELGMFVGPQG